MYRLGLVHTNLNVVKLLNSVRKTNQGRKIVSPACLNKQDRELSNFGFKQGRGLKASVAQLSTKTSVECPAGSFDNSDSDFDFDFFAA